MDPLTNMPNELKPQGMIERESKRGMLERFKAEVTKKRPKSHFIGWLLLVLVLIVVSVQFINSARYEAWVQVIKEDHLGVNPTGERLDFGDLPRNKDATRTVTIESKGDTAVYVMVWKFGAISDLMKIDKNYFTVKPHTTEKVQFSVHVPNSADFKYYRGNVIIWQLPKIW